VAKSPPAPIAAIRRCIGPTGSIDRTENAGGQAMADFKAAWERTPRLLKQADCPKGQYLDRKFLVQI